MTLPRKALKSCCTILAEGLWHLIMFSISRCVAWHSLTAALAALTLAAIPAIGQTPPHPAPAARTIPTVKQAFEVASVRVVDPNSKVDHNDPADASNQPQTFPANRWTTHYIQMLSLICAAYSEIKCENVVGGPPWFFTNEMHYDISAKVEGNAMLTKDQMKPMLRTLLEERFHLKAHREPKIVPGYALTIPNGGAKLQPNKGAPSFGMFGGFNIKFQNISLESFARVLAGPLKQPVIDRTGLTGMYDFDFKFAPRESISNDPAFAEQYAGLPDIVTVLQEQYGLKLVAEKITLDTLVIDHVDKIPTEN